MEIGDNLKNFSLKATDNKVYNSVKQMGDKGLLIVVTCNHCPYARAYWRRFFLLMKKFEPKGINFLYINANDYKKYREDSFKGMVNLWDQFDRKFIYLHDESQDVVKMLHAVKTPEVFLYNNDKKLVYKGGIDNFWESEAGVTHKYLEQAMEDMIVNERILETNPTIMGCTIKWKENNHPSYLREEKEY